MNTHKRSNFNHLINQIAKFRISLLLYFFAGDWLSKC